MSTPEENLLSVRREKLLRLRQEGRAYPNDFARTHLASQLELLAGEENPPAVAIAGRLVAKRVMGKASFAHLLDMSGKTQVHATLDRLGEAGYEAFKELDLGDLVGARGTLFRTKTGELTVAASDIRLLAKALLPLPEKFHGLADPETRHRQRYLDLIANESTRRVFAIRAQVIRFLREFLLAQGYLEAETPMMQPLPGGAAAKPFITHHNALGRDLYLRISPELYLKRLVVGGMEKVFELNRSFRNEGISSRHNPEFTMLEFYEAYANWQHLMAMTEEMLHGLALAIHGSPGVSSGGHSLDFTPPYPRLTLAQALALAYPGAGEKLEDEGFLRGELARLGVKTPAEDDLYTLQCRLFDEAGEEKLISPTFVTGYPVKLSPLARRMDGNPLLVERFELYIGGREIANGFSELNDPEDQASRFAEQATERALGEEEAMFYDEDYVRALEYGLPPTAGEGIGVDRLVMVFADAPSIREVILFPHLRDK